MELNLNKKDNGNNNNNGDNIEKEMNIQKKYQYINDDENILDRTNIPYPGGISTIKDLNSNLVEIHLVHCSLKSMQGFPEIPNLKKLVLRDNLIEKIEDIEKFPKLEELDLYLNKLKIMENLNIPSLTFLDLSFNKFKEIKNLDNLILLKELYLINNKISSLANISHLTNLTLLELGDNRIRKVENISSLVNLGSLFIGKNRITELENLNTFSKLKVLSVQSNRLTEIKNLEDLKELEELYISHNGIIKLGGNLSSCLNLRVLDVAGNKMTELDDINNPILEDLWLNDNQIESWKGIESLGKLTTLQTVYLEGNPIHKNDPQYRNKLAGFIPSLTQIDSTFVKRNNITALLSQNTKN
eukprot:TRINITY_DN9312_c0_g1_i1.p1 TRINITY_DN9312_c0_g1~~TRINITY_DN9312_c0_g1_i1.p1  ORF type:complete len:357 (-),score=127.72 TRINITY_DN9312_c0_g1_i1:23-1093(-)